MAAIGARARAAAADLAFAAPERSARRCTPRPRRSMPDAPRSWRRMPGHGLRPGKGLSPAMLDRLMLDAARIDGIVAGLRAVAEQKPTPWAR
jgi:glutamate-5-semialdehyde dehydrogenase